MKKAITIFLTLLLVFTMPIPAMAASGTVDLIDGSTQESRVSISGVDTATETDWFTINYRDYDATGKEVQAQRKVPIYPASGEVKVTLTESMNWFEVTQMVKLGDGNWSFDGEWLPIAGKASYTTFEEPEDTDSENTGDGYDNIALIGKSVEHVIDAGQVTEDMQIEKGCCYLEGCTVSITEPGLYYIYGSIGPVLGFTEGFVRINSAASTESAPAALPGGALNGYVPADWAKPEVYAARDSGLLPDSAYWLNSYNCSANIDRERFCELATRLYCVQNELVWEMLVPAENPFNDTFSMEVAKMNELGVVDGMGGGAFNPTGELTREQAAKILTLLYNVLEPGSYDATHNYWTGKAVADSGSVGTWAQNFVGFVMEKGIMTGVGGNKFDPKGKYTNAQAILTMYRLAGRTDLNLMKAPVGINIHDLGLSRDAGSSTLIYEAISGSSVSSIECTSLKLNGTAVEFTTQSYTGGGRVAFGQGVSFEDLALGEAYGRITTRLTKYELELNITMADGTVCKLTDTFQYINGSFGGA